MSLANIPTLNYIILAYDLSLLYRSCYGQ